MIKRTLYFGNPAYLKTDNLQLVAELKKEEPESHTIPIEDIGIIILDNPQITITSGLMSRLLEQNVGLVTCDGTHHPVGLMLNLEGHTLQSQKHQAQVEVSQPLKKQCWQQTIMAKIDNQARLLKSLGMETNYLTALRDKVKSGDSDNCEAKAAVYYWRHLFAEVPDFRRERYGPPPNNLLNYGYAILRALVARALVGSGLLPSLGIFHRNQYNAYCLADDIMEPYRPYVDRLAYQIWQREGEKASFLEPGLKKELLSIPATDTRIDGKKSPLMTAVSRTTASLARCFEGESRKILYPEL
ncbi:MAG TPA: type II CRISPR-associated endonuclease Cas1 [Chitinophagaceae bacterium]|nr:type II CRISPR-associated endonuclease Cas1 [Chitinophagaceae bacterium]